MGQPDCAGHLREVECTCAISPRIEVRADTILCELLTELVFC